MEAPLGFIHLRDAADRVGRKLYGSSWGSIAERLPFVARIRVQQKLEPDGDGWRWDDGWWWCVISAEQVIVEEDADRAAARRGVIAEGDADTEAAARQAARDAALKAGLLLDAPKERDPKGEHVARMIAKACGRSELFCVTGNGPLDRGVWQRGWYDLVATETINVDVPVADTLEDWQRDMRELAARNGWRLLLERCDSPGGWIARFFRDNEHFTKEITSRVWAGTRRDTREIFVREEDFERFIAAIPEPVTEQAESVTTQSEPIAKPTQPEKERQVADSTKVWVTNAVKEMRKHGQFSERTRITNLAKTLADRMDKAVEAGKVRRPVGWRHIKNELPKWGLWPIKKIK
jgi:hypothetical protein